MASGCALSDHAVIAVQSTVLPTLALIPAYNWCDVSGLTNVLSRKKFIRGSEQLKKTQMFYLPIRSTHLCIYKIWARKWRKKLSDSTETRLTSTGWGIYDTPHHQLQCCASGSPGQRLDAACKKIRNAIVIRNKRRKMDDYFPSPRIPCSILRLHLIQEIAKPHANFFHSKSITLHSK